MGQHALKTLALCLLVYPIPVASYTYYRDDESCDLVGDGDIYGIGIRISIYIQSFTAIIGLLASGPEILRPLRFGFNAIATAIVINFFKDINRNGFLYLEYWIIFAQLQFILWILNYISILMIIATTMKEDSNLGYFSIAWTFLLSSILLVTQIWLYWDGINLGHHTDCKEMINFYVPVDMYAKKWHYFLRASSVLAASTLLPATVLGVVLYFILGFWVEFKKLNASYTILFLITLLPTTFSPTISYTLVGLFALVSGIIWTEGTIRVNNIDLSGATISSSGQLISLIVTIFTSIPILWTIFLAFFTGGNPQPAENQQHVNTSAEEPTNGTDLRHQERENQTVGPVMAGHLGIDAGNIV
ncbi:hypothetical protein CFAM422_002540 [Trichoderma lentiforme]|uniref:Uncharacterized protein n=1 Tax=Trichoderma lentiforme TaxID=1567552 RepID=A0A9P4XN47_9HYPO|nr:hypothetical protein CFAM422_002540 [Trichoderma lentiforme]